MQHHESSHLLIEQAKKGDRLALERLLLNYYGVLAADISSRLPVAFQSLISVEDVTQEAMLQAYQKIHLLRDTSTKAFMAWLKAIGRTTLMSLIREQTRQKRGGRHRSR